MPPTMPMMPRDPQGGDMPTCPCCGQPMPMPYNSNSAPQMPMPPMAPQGGDDSALLAMLMGGMGGGGGMSPMGY